MMIVSVSVLKKLVSQTNGFGSYTTSWCIDQVSSAIVSSQRNLMIGFGRRKVYRHIYEYIYISLKLFINRTSHIHFKVSFKSTLLFFDGPTLFCIVTVLSLISLSLSLSLFPFSPSFSSFSVYVAISFALVKFHIFSLLRLSQTYFPFVFHFSDFFSLSKENISFGVRYPFIIMQSNDCHV